MKMLIISLVLLAFAQLIKSDCRTCTDCVQCLSKTPGYNPGTHLITVSTAGCADYPINWLCCRSSADSKVSSVSELTACNLYSCNSEFEDDKIWDLDMCQDVSYLSFEVPTTANFITIQLQENCFNGNVDCAAKGDCCGNAVSSCPYGTGVCEQIIDLSTCTSDVPEPECVSNEDCSRFEHECSSGLCVNGACVEAFHGSDIICRPTAGDCDQEERCDGYSNFCPLDLKKPEGEVCREKVSSCDFEETCDGWSNDCPYDTWEGPGVECRPANDKCDLPEYCTGDSAHCPDDFGHDYGYTFKCAGTQFLCGVKRHELSLGSGGSYFIGSGANICGIGTGNTFVDLDYPACLDDCLEKDCPNKRGLSNWSESHCDPYTGLWVCDNKVDVISTTKLPYCPVWDK